MNKRKLLFLFFLLSFLLVSAISQEVVPVEREVLKEILEKVESLEIALEAERTTVRELLLELSTLQKEREISQKDWEKAQAKLRTALNNLAIYQDRARILQLELNELGADSGKLTRDLEKWQEDCRTLERQLAICWTEIDKLTRQRNNAAGIAIIEFILIILLIIF